MQYATLYLAERLGPKLCFFLCGGLAWAGWLRILKATFLAWLGYDCMDGIGQLESCKSSRLHSWHGLVIIAWMALIGQLVSCKSSLKATFLAWLGSHFMDGIAAIPHLRLHS